MSLKVFDVIGREIATLVSENLNAGTYGVNWSADGFASGVYLYRLQAGDFVSVKRMILLR